VWVSEIYSERDWYMATIPAPEARFHVRALVMYGRVQYMVTDFGDRGVKVTARFALPSKRPMRRCPRRDRIVAAVRGHRSYAVLADTPCEVP
jgi:hypothetical protein